MMTLFGESLEWYPVGGQSEKICGYVGRRTRRGRSKELGATSGACRENDFGSTANFQNADASRWRGTIRKRTLSRGHNVMKTLRGARLVNVPKKSFSRAGNPDNRVTKRRLWKRVRRFRGMSCATIASRLKSLRLLS